MTGLAVTETESESSPSEGKKDSTLKVVCCCKWCCQGQKDMITYKLICQAAFLAPKKSFRLSIKGYWQTCDDKNGGIAVDEVVGAEVVDVTGAEVVVVDVFV